MYDYQDNGIVKTAGPEPYPLSNFNAWITHETTYEDGMTSYRILTIEGKQGKEKLPAINVPADKYASMSWVTTEWGVGAIITPYPSAERDLRVAIQMNSKPKKTTIYTHTGWAKIGGRTIAFLTANGAITAKAHRKDVKVQLPTELQRVQIVPDSAKSKEGVLATLALETTAPAIISWPLIVSAIRPPIGAADYAIHLSGRTGTFKSEMASIIQSHYGQGLDARHLPGSWSSTANALEAQCYKAKDIVFAVDDFVPFGTSTQVRQMQKTADQVIRAAGNQAGRARMTDRSMLQTTMYPRSLIVSTGEDIPQGHSIRARMFILDLAPGDIKTSQLSAAQENRPLYSIGIAAWIQWLAQQGPRKVQVRHQERATELRIKHKDVGHTRTPSTLGDMISCVELYIEFAVAIGAIAKNAASGYIKRATQALLDGANDQERHLRTADPVEVFFDVLRLVLSNGQAHLAAMDGGIPVDPTLFGWTEQQTATSHQIKTYNKHGQRIGWVNDKEAEILLEPNLLFPVIQKNSRGQLTVTKPTLYKRLKDAGQLTRTDEQRQRNTVRVTVEGRSRAVLAILIPTVTGTQEHPA